VEQMVPKNRIVPTPVMPEE